MLRGHHEAVSGLWPCRKIVNEVASLSEDGSVRLWDLGRRRSVQIIFKGVFHQMRGMTYTPDGYSADVWRR